MITILQILAHLTWEWFHGTQNTFRFVSVIGVTSITRWQDEPGSLLLTTYQMGWSEYMAWQATTPRWPSWALWSAASSRAEWCCWTGAWEKSAQKWRVHSFWGCNTQLKINGWKENNTNCKVGFWLLKEAFPLHSIVSCCDIMIDGSDSQVFVVWHFDIYYIKLNIDNMIYTCSFRMNLSCLFTF